MEKQIADGNIGAVGKYDIDYKEGAVKAGVSFAYGPVKSSHVLELNAVDAAIIGLKAAKDLIPGKIDDVIFDGAIAALQALK